METLTIVTIPTLFLSCRSSQVDKEFAKFKDTNLDIYKTHYAPLFRDCVAIGDQTMTPLPFQNTSNSNDFPNEVKGKGVNDEVSLDEDEDIFCSFVGSNMKKRKKFEDANNRSSKSKSSSFEEKLDVVLDALTTKSSQRIAQNTPTPTIYDCMNIVIKFPSLNKGSKNYSQALYVFIKKQNREAFMFSTTHEAKMEFLKLLMEERVVCLKCFKFFEPCMECFVFLCLSRVPT
ncbi:hypothetical protein R6Q59_003670 [Mikania micrantha]